MTAAIALLDAMNAILPRAAGLAPRLESIPGESKVPSVLVGLLVPFCLGTIFVMLRFWVRAYMTRNWGCDDTLLLIAWLLGLAACILGCVATAYGVGHHLKDIPVKYLTTSSQLAFVYIVMYQATVGVSKISACCFYKRIFTTGRIRYFLTGMLVFIAVYSLASIIPIIVACEIQGNFLGAACGKTLPKIFYFNAACGIVVDLVLIITAVPQVLALKMAWRQKAAVLSVVALGLFVVAASVIRIVLNEKEAYISYDHTWNRTKVLIWSMAEISVGLICLSATTLNPLILKFIPKIADAVGETANRLTETVHRNVLVYLEKKDEIPIPYSQTLTQTTCVAQPRPPPPARLASCPFWRKNGEPSTLPKSESTEDVLRKSEGGQPADMEMGIYKHMSVSIKYEDRKAVEDAMKTFSDQHSDASDDIFSKDFKDIM